MMDAAPKSGMSLLVALLTLLAGLLVWCLPVMAVERAVEDAEELSESQEYLSEIREKRVEPYHYASAYGGYRFVSPDGVPFAAAPYVRLKSGATGGFSAGTLGEELKLSVDAALLHEDDYHAELFFDYGGLVRFHAESTALWNNLLRETVTPATLVLNNREQGREYGSRTSMTQFDSRIKFGNRPLHLNLGYWELRREGYDQLRFSDHYFFGTTANTLVSDTRTLSTVTREGTVGMDAHLGPFDLSYGFRIRDFSNGAADPRYPFTPALVGGPTGDRHNTIPDSRVTSHTFKFFTDLSGGLIGSASYNLTERENTGGHGDARLSERPADLLQTVTGDLAYTPSKRHSFALKYRHREIDRTTPATLVYPYDLITALPIVAATGNPGELRLRPASSSVKDTLTFSATFRPGPKVIYRLEYNAELEQRSNILAPQSPVGSLTTLHSDNRQTHTGTFTFYWKPVKGGKLNATYSYASSNNQAYGDSFGSRHTGKLLATYTTSTHWGLAANYLAQFSSGSRTAFTNVDQNKVYFSLPHESHDQAVSANLWFVPVERLTITTHYSYLKNEASRNELFSDLITDANPQTVTNYHSSSHVYGVGATYAVTEPLDLSLAFQQVRSQARYAVPERTFILKDSFGNLIPASTSGITALSRLDSTETSVNARADWRFNKHLGCVLDYNMRRYVSGDPLFDGTVHLTTIHLKGTW